VHFCFVFFFSLFKKIIKKLPCLVYAPVLGRVGGGGGVGELLGLEQKKK
jgi:hypothetical protein